jgi:hypothetical protein
MDGTQVNELERQASEASLRALAEQESRLRDLRSRAGTLLAATSICASFMGTRAVGVEGAELAVWLAGAAFVATLLATIYVLVPSKRLVFALDGAELYNDLWEIRADVDEIHRRIAYWMAWYRSENQPALLRIERAYRAAAFALVVQILLWGACLVFPM